MNTFDKNLLISTIVWKKIIDQTLNKIEHNNKTMIIQNYSINYIKEIIYYYEQEIKRQISSIEDEIENSIEENDWNAEVYEYLDSD